MKKKALFTILTSLLILVNGISQVELVKDFLKHPTAIDFHNEKAYVTIQGLTPNEGKLVSFDLDNPSQTCITHFENLSQYPRCIATHENIAYIGFNNYIGKIDLNQQNFEIDIFTTSILSPKCLTVKNDILYIAENYKISYINLLDQNPELRVLVDDLNYKPLSIALKDQDLYFTGANNIFKISVDDVSNNVEEVLLDLETTVYSIAIIGNELYFDQTYLIPQKRISKIDLENSESNIENIVSNIGSALHMNYFDSTLYFVSPTESNNGQIGKIFKLTEPIINSNNIEEFEIIKTYPNPANSFISIDYPHVNNFEISIYNYNGQLVMKLSGNNRIDIQHLNPGIFLMEFKDNGIIKSRSKFIKISI